MTHIERCRELAERLVEPTTVRLKPGQEFTCNVYDPRFAALRGEHEPDQTTVYCRRCEDYIDRDPYCLRTDGDALDEAIAACGFIAVELFTPTYLEADHWSAVLVREYGYEGEAVNSAQAIGPTPREAKSAALYQAIVG
jgi:hypothetical protein